MDAPVDMVQAPRSWETAAIVNPRCPLLVCVLSACSSNPGDSMRDACMDLPIVASGSVELGLGTTFAPVANGQNVDLQLGAQGLWMFVVSARTCDMNV